LDTAQCATLSALLDRLFPADDGTPGALEIGAADYLLQALDGAYAHLRGAYGPALDALDRAAHDSFGRGFAALAPEARDTLIDRLERCQLGTLTASEAQEFFELVWLHLREGLFCDPVHGGNRDMLGWRLIGFLGAQYGYTAEEQQLDVQIQREPRSVATLDLSGRIGGGEVA
jgi:hypothetical protein